MSEQCEVCGGAVEVRSTREGTIHYVPVERGREGGEELLKVQLQVGQLTQALELTQHDLEVAVTGQRELASKAVEMVKIIEERDRQLAAVAEALRDWRNQFGMGPAVGWRKRMQDSTDVLLADLPTAAQRRESE